MKKYLESSEKRRKHRTRIALRASGRLRLSVFRSGRYIYAQAIDDVRRCTVASASSIEKEAAEVCVSKSNCEAATWVGKRLGQKLLSLGFKEVVFDRGAYRFHGRVKALADAARSEGLSF